MSDLTLLLLALGIPIGLLLVWYVVRELLKRLRWDRMWKDLLDIADMDEGRERWHRFLRDDGSEHQIALPETEKIFQGMWRDTRSEREVSPNIQMGNGKHADHRTKRKMTEMTLSEKKEYALSLCQELYNLIDTHNGILVEITEVLDNLEMTWWQRILFFIAKWSAGRGIKSDMKLVKIVERSKSALNMDGEDVDEDKVDNFIADLKRCIADQKHHIHQAKEKLAELQKP